MVDPIMALTALQLVVPVAIAALPPIWKQIVTVLNRIKDRSQGTNWACLQTILDTLERVPDLYALLSHNQLLLNKLKLKAEAVEKALNRKTFRQSKDSIAQDINIITVMMQQLDLSIRVRQLGRQGHETPKEYNVQDGGGLEAYHKRMENLFKDLCTKLDEDDLAPVIMKTSADYWAFMKKSGTYPKISYLFNHTPEDSYPKTLTVSRGVRECLEVVLKWLRDLKDINKGRDSSLVVGVAFYELFTEVLPQVLMENLIRSRRVKLNIQSARQFHSNLCFLRSFSASEAFMRIQGEDGLQLEEDDKVKLDLQHELWETWEVVQNKSESYIFKLQENNPSLAGGETSSRAGGTFFQCPTCPTCLMVDSLATISLSEKHLPIFRERMQNSNAHTGTFLCPVCGFVMDHLSDYEKGLHTNVCLDS